MWGPSCAKPFRYIKLEELCENDCGYMHRPSWIALLRLWRRSLVVCKWTANRKLAVESNAELSGSSNAALRVRFSSRSQHSADWERSGTSDYQLESGSRVRRSRAIDWNRKRPKCDFLAYPRRDSFQLYGSDFVRQHLDDRHLRRPGRSVLRAGVDQWHFHGHTCSASQRHLYRHACQLCLYDGSHRREPAHPHFRVRLLHPELERRRR